MKIKCVKAECPICKATGSIQLFLNKDGKIKYARTRHYSHLDKDSKKPQFTYCRIEDLEILKANGINLPDLVGQESVTQNSDISSLNTKIQVSPTSHLWARSLARIKVSAFGAGDRGFKSHRARFLK